MFVKPESVTFEQKRWEVIIRIVDAHGVEREYIASADTFFTEQDHIWFGTREDYDAAARPIGLTPREIYDSKYRR